MVLGPFGMFDSEVEVTVVIEVPEPGWEASFGEGMEAAGANGQDARGAASAESSCVFVVFANPHPD